MKDTQEIHEDQEVSGSTEVDPLLKSPSQKKVFRALLLQRLAAAIGILAFGVLYLFLSDKIVPSFIPRWLPLALDVVLVIPLFYSVIMHRHISQKLTRIFGFILAGVATIALVASIGLLLATLPHREAKDSIGLIRDAAILWVSNILVFGLWYWELDGGGPLQRHINNHKAIDFMFPQQVDGDTDGWAPHFIDYVFLAFNTATAFSPTDTPPLSRSAKVLMMIESIISFVVVAGLAARAINILGN